MRYIQLSTTVRRRAKRKKSEIKKDKGNRFCLGVNIRRLCSFYTTVIQWHKGGKVGRIPPKEQLRERQRPRQDNVKNRKPVHS